MGFLREVDLGPSFPPFATFREHFGFVPNLFRAQTLLPRLIEAETDLVSAVLLKEGALSRIPKERMLVALAAAHRNTYCVTMHYQILRLLGVPERQLDLIIADFRQAGLPPVDAALLELALNVGQIGLPSPLVQGLTDEGILEAILATALTNFLCTLSTGLGATPEFEPNPIPTSGSPPVPTAPAAGPDYFLHVTEREAEEFAPFAFFRERFGFVPNIFKAQASRPDLLEAEGGVIRAILLNEDILKRVQKERILLVVSAANLNACYVAELFRGPGLPAEEPNQIAVDHRQARLSDADKALLDFARKLGVQPADFCLEDVEELGRHRFSHEQILEAVAMTALTKFLNTLQTALGAVPDVAPRRTFQPSPASNLHLLPSVHRQTDEVDPDAECVARVRNGDVDAFEEVINRHSRRVYRILVGILGDPDEARDAMQETFLKAFQHLREFQQRSKFSTWLVSIARNAGIQRLRERTNLESLDEGPDDKGFRPFHIRAWIGDPEQAYAKEELRMLVEKAVMRLPAKYRVVVMLRDIEQLSIEEAATALNLGIPALKARLLRGRLMVREALSPHFVDHAKGVSS
jgi:RNA polymerase sigma-70 factor, ECF subfamily